jgi:hypothetical protein
MRGRCERAASSVAPGWVADRNQRGQPGPRIPLIDLSKEDLAESCCFGLRHEMGLREVESVELADLESSEERGRVHGLDCRRLNPRVDA